jgi:tyrosine-protein kinase Etk/Wzc
MYVVRSNYSEVQLCEFINECKDDNKIKNINIVLNGVGSSQSYGYKYGYQYGYKYGYNYGYGYGYSEEKE